MKLEGYVTTVKSCDVDVSKEEIYKAVEKLIKKKYSHVFAKGDHICGGYWQVYSFTDGHNGDDHYDKGPEPTEEDYKIMEHLEFIRKVLTN